MYAKKAMVSKIKNGHCMIVTDDGQFKRIPLPRKPVQVGQIINYKEPSSSKWFKPVLMVASFFIVFIGLYAYQQSLPPGPLTYLTIDINPSIQLGLNSSDNVVEAVPLNADGEKLLGQLDYQDRSYDVVVEDLVAEAAKQGYLADSEENVIVASLYNQAPTPLEKSQEQKVRKSIGQSLGKKKLKAKVMVYKVDKKVWQEAKKSGLSAGKLAFSREMQTKGIEISNTELKKNSIKKILKSYPHLPEVTPAVNQTVYTKPVIKEYLKALKQKGEQNKKPFKLTKDKQNKQATRLTIVEERKSKKVPIIKPTVSTDVYAEQALIEEPKKPFQQKLEKPIKKVKEKKYEKRD